MIGTGRLVIDGRWLDEQIATLRASISRPSVSQSAYERDSSALETLRDIRDNRVEGFI